MRTTGESLRRVLPGLLAAVLAGGLLAGCADQQQERDLREARARVQELTAEKTAAEEALVAAQQVILEITTYSYRAGQHDFAWLEKVHDQELKDRLAPNVADLQEVIRRGRVVAKGEIVDSAARVVDPTQVEVLAFVDQAITDARGEDVKVEQQRVSMTMRLVDDAWLVDRLELLSGDNTALAP